VSLLSAFAVVLVSSLGFFPGHLALTGVWIVVVAASIVSLGAASTTFFQNLGKQEQQAGTTTLRIWMPVAGALTVAIAGGFLLVSPLISNERVNEATALIERVMRTDVANVQPYLERSLTLLAYARQENPLDAQIYQSAGTAHWFLEQFEDALKDFSYAALLDPTPEAFTNLGETYRGMGKLDMAEKSYDTALLYNPDFEKARNAKALVEKMRAEKKP
jgi:tetratricopeptide (TPR) repeat protein